MTPFIYLASQSPRRSQLLDQLGICHQLLLAHADGEAEEAEALETALPGESPTAYVQRVTGLKLDAAVARRAHRGLPEAPILCADTTVAYGRTIYGKPENTTEAARILGELAGKTHRVLTAVALQHGAQRRAVLSVSRVTFDAMTTAHITDYINTGEPMGKAGAYGIQGCAAAHILRLNGSYSGIMGLPLFETAQLLRWTGINFGPPRSRVS